MDKNRICEAMYALPGDEVVRRRKPFVVPATIFAVGVAMIVLNNIYGGDLSVNIRSAVVFLGGAIALFGGTFLAARIFSSSGAPFHNSAHCYLRYEELYFDRRLRGEVWQAVSDGGVEKLLEMEHSQVPALSLAIYRTPDNRFAAMQLFEYADLEYRPLTELKVVHG